MVPKDETHTTDCTKSNNFVVSGAVMVSIPDYANVPVKSINKLIQNIKIEKLILTFAGISLIH